MIDLADVGGKVSLFLKNKFDLSVVGRWVGVRWSIIIVFSYNSGSRAAGIVIVFFGQYKN